MDTFIQKMKIVIPKNNIINTQNSKRMNDHEYNVKKLIMKQENNKNKSNNISQPIIKCHDC